MSLEAKYQTARIVSRKEHAPGLWSVRLQLEERLDFQPGQYCTLGVEVGGKIVERAYSIVSAPQEPELELFFELVANGALTPRLHELGPGDTMLARRRAKGNFILDVASGRKRHFLAGTVTGVAPYVSMIRSLAKGPERPSLELVVLQSASRSIELAYAEELAAAAGASGGWLRYVPTVSRPWEDPGWTGEVGRCEDVLRKVLDAAGFSAQNSVGYLCGNPGMIENAKGILLRAGFAREMFHVEIYWMPKKEKKVG